MPETFWTVRWPDGSEDRLYSPSSVVAELFEPGRSYPTLDFLQRARVALVRASNRVERKYGFACTSAMEQLDRIEARIDSIPDKQGCEIACLTISQQGATR